MTKDFSINIKWIYSKKNNQCAGYDGDRIINLWVNREFKLPTSIIWDLLTYNPYIIEPFNERKSIKNNSKNQIWQTLNLSFSQNCLIKSIINMSNNCLILLYFSQKYGKIS